MLLFPRRRTVVLPQFAGYLSKEMLVAAPQVPSGLPSMSSLPVQPMRKVPFSQLKTRDEKLRVLNSFARMCGGDLPGTIKNAG